MSTFSKHYLVFLQFSSRFLFLIEARKSGGQGQGGEIKTPNFCVSEKNQTIKMIQSCCLWKKLCREINTQKQPFAGALKKFAIFTQVLESLFNKETPTHVFSWVYGEIFKTSFFCRKRLVAASHHSAFLLILPHFAQWFHISLLYERSWTFAAFLEHFQAAALKGSHWQI